MIDRGSVPEPSSTSTTKRNRQSEISIEFQNVMKIYRVQKQHQQQEKVITAVNDVSFQLEHGKTLVLVGSSGCGKSTILKMINRLVESTSGKILVEGVDVTEEDPVKLRRRIGYVIQEVGLFPHLTVEQNLSILPKLEGWNKIEIHKRVDHLLRKVKLDPEIFTSRYPRELSGGQAQRVGIARALVLDPNILLMDEPFGALDPIIRAELQDEFLSLIQRESKKSKTIVFVTHDLNEALKLGNIVAVMNEGKIIQLDSPQNLLKRQVDTFVSNFIGSDKILKLLSISMVKEILDINRQRENILSKSHISKQEYEKLDTSINVTEDTNCLLALETMLQNRRTYLPVIRNSNNDSNTAIDIITFELIMEYIHR
ncbi:MAG: glycine betaine ABC transporter ATP-binding protein [Thaumarchaeota archaeon]|nr:glycine betaine ABC transporter ATP-binding protein [Nitrososphaerota archaeon]|tara:strand:+ start:1108 stop:2217 length:1110 start_codon:yes stop_codon:yes gene_type:complete